MKELGSTPRLAPGDYGELCRVLRKILQKDRCAAGARGWVGTGGLPAKPCSTSKSASHRSVNPSHHCSAGICSIVPVAAAAADVCTVLACGLRDNFTSQAKVGIVLAVSCEASFAAAALCLEAAGLLVSPLFPRAKRLAPASSRVCCR